MTTTELETLNLIQPMDDMKREMHIRARAHIVSGKTSFICWALLDELADTFNGAWMPGKFKFQGGWDILNDEGINSLLEEFFPEFFALYDNYYWPDYSVKELESIESCVAIFKGDPHGAWFAYLDKARRLSLLDFLITHR